MVGYDYAVVYYVDLNLYIILHVVLQQRDPGLNGAGHHLDR